MSQKAENNNFYEDYEHLIPPIVKEIRDNAADKERIDFIRKPKFIRHSKAEAIFKMLDELFYAPREDRMQSYLFAGDGNMGKTYTIKRYIKMKNNQDDLNDIQTKIPVLYVLAPVKANYKVLYDNILTALQVPFRTTDSDTQKEVKIATYIEDFQVKMLIIDEVHNGLTGSANQQKEFTNAIKNLSNILRIPIVLVGVGEAVSLVDRDHQLKSRFKPIKIKNWEIDDEFRAFLKSVELTLPLKEKSYIYTDGKFVTKIHQVTNGITGDVISIINKMAIRAIEKKKEKIDIKLFNEIDYITVDNSKIYAQEIWMDF